MGTQGVELERAGEKSAVDGSDPHVTPFVHLFIIIIWRHGSASILGTTRTVTRAPMLMYWAGLSRIASPRERRPK